MKGDKLKICHVLDRLETGGMENGVVNICNNLDRNKFTPVILCVKGLGVMRNRLNPDVEVLCFGAKDERDLLRPLKLAKFIKKFEFDVVHTHGWGACSFSGIVGAVLAGVAVVINGEHGTFFLKKHQIFAQKLLSVLCDVTLSVSGSLKIEIEKKLRIPGRSIQVIANGVDTGIFNGCYDLEPDRFNFLREEKIIIGCIGSLKAIKNQIMLLKALKLTLEENPSAPLSVVFVGDGPDNRMLNDYVNEKKMGSKVFFLGRRQDVPELLTLIDVLVSTSKTEGAPNVLLEAMASGVPVISTNSGGAKEYVIDGENGYLVELDDVSGLKEKIQLLLDEKKRKSLGGNGRDFVIKNYSIKKMVSEYEQLYLALYAKKFGRAK